MKHTVDTTFISILSFNVILQCDVVSSFSLACMGQQGVFKEKAKQNLQTSLYQQQLRRDV